jgi:hypothetical protein
MKMLDFYFHDGRGVLEIEIDGEKFRFMDLDVTPTQASGCERRFEPDGDAWTFRLVDATGAVIYWLTIPYHRGERQ